MENEKIINEEVETVENSLMVKNFNEIGNSRRSKQEVFTTIKDAKQIFNLNNSCDYKLNDCIDEVLRVKDVLVKTIMTPLAEPIMNEETGEIEKDMDFKKITILIDDNGKSYVTASKMFANQFIDYLMMFGFEELRTEGLEIRIIKKTVKNSQNKALAFELV